ncbi:hypothetical protein JRO89_XS01G0365100 [Xanthoceras sorbifolium]|uniref:J domain-containing protein n=1 Tax=Xanthoceras sorbifolium TaxID=99658 RepID=A0ABQ8INK5_9ROSI|nr:hypothetical protein JRO89_XS01G0365100 [Xanthoceras sorbifolium]
MSNGGPCYYSVPGLHKQASATEIRDAYLKLALKWHPDRCMKDPVVAEEAKWRFQQIQEAYSVLSDKEKKTIYDAGLLGLLGDDNDEEGYSLEDLQGLLMDMIADDQKIDFGLKWDASQSTMKRTRVI